MNRGSRGYENGWFTIGSGKGSRYLFSRTRRLFCVRYMGLNRGKRGYEKDGVRAKTVPAIFTSLDLDGKLAAYVP